MGKQSEDEQRRDRAIKRMLETPPTPHEPIGKKTKSVEEEAGEAPARDTSPARKP